MYAQFNATTDGVPLRSAKSPLMPKTTCQTNWNCARVNTCCIKDKDTQLGACTGHGGKSVSDMQYYTAKCTQGHPRYVSLARHRCELVRVRTCTRCLFVMGFYKFQGYTEKRVLPFNFTPAILLLLCADQFHTSLHTRLFLRALWTKRLPP